MNQEQKTRAMADGKARTASKIEWLLSVRNALHMRCLRLNEDTYVVQVRTDKGWVEELGRGSDPVALLQKVATSKGPARVMDR
jgi:hypothetical protein